MKRDKKELIVQQVTEKLEKAQGIYLTDFQGLDVAKMAELRNEFRKVGVEYRVVKNTLVKKALENVAGGDRLAEGLYNTTGVAIGYDDPIVAAKVIEKFSKKNENLKFKMAAIDGSVFEASQLPQLASMLSKVENIGRVAGLVNNMVASVPMVVNAVMRDLVSVLDQVAKQKQ
ncbi:MAG: 50S ribosomal protein L10 [Prosthecochloris sp.]|uniref:Large ribosomal subunit protein uL10 n=1 Tax=Prosthecochloris aestuarii (strain DSM 271 / SK 413) TaxID=290512 RepID=RL10_PROA2|nr:MULTISPECIES: 50S ribosomal protein L10 [Prosthecochloris]B4S495.1 RecName: Full=Large ribosomal subunit protein uL10; AltName: Full=50S ribosomal protein L10 [Prosthecochloris aestuarii DSM 271]ACF45343.1 ribosomal protein L10 [Prosthecochloris aestuarii DSM 271]MCW8798893.1 50S ribosomal protein L10 [Prosthecochloris sp.]NEX12996.1 50S ribosomal protein L10 [Prosthecochloris sp.]RDD31453.1 50S ribosomal protein L10 [Prosthecochloris sp. ZM]